MRYGVLTNGQKWRMYDSQTTMKSPEVEFDITDSDGVVLSKAIRLHRSVVLDSIPRQSPTKVEPAPSGPGDEVPIANIKYTKDMARPRELVCPDKNVPLGSWIDLLYGVADWLVAKKHLGKSHCPVPIGPNNAILNAWPVHQNGKQFSTHREVGKLYLNTNADPATAIKYAIKLIEKAGLKPSDFKVYFEDPNRPDPRPKTNGNA